MKAASLTIVLLMSSLGAGQAGPDGSLRVRVIDSNTKTPIAGANVTVDNRKETWSRTDAAGIFTARSLPAGTHLVTVTRRHYRMNTGGMGAVVETRPGFVSETTVELLPLGVLAGRVLDQYGDPVRAAIVRTLEQRNDRGVAYYDGSSHTVTDDRGEYRIADVRPGSHYVMAEFSQEHNERFSGVRSRFRWPDSGGFLLYPSTADIGKAQKVEVAPGGITRLEDMRLSILRAVTISGRVKPAGVASVNIRRAGPTLGSAIYPSGGGGTQTKPDGSFRVQALPANYEVSAFSQSTGKISQPVTVEALDRDIANLELELNSRYEIRGRIAIVGGGPLDLTKLELNLTDQPVKIESSGAFRADLVRKEAYYTLHRLPEGWYVKEASVSGRPLVGRHFQAELGVNDFALVLSPGGAQLDITVTPTEQTLPVVQVGLIPDTGPLPQVDELPRVEPDQTGVFKARAVPPGSYRVFALDASNWGLLFDPGGLREKHRLAAQLVTLSEGEQKSITISPTKVRP